MLNHRKQRLPFNAGSRGQRWTLLSATCDDPVALKTTLQNLLATLEGFYNTPAPKGVCELIYSRKELDKKVAKNTPDWVAAITKAHCNTIYILSPSVISQESCHRKSSFQKILTHELAHIFHRTINSRALRWVDEGIALFVARQEKPCDFTRAQLNQFLQKALSQDITVQSFVRLRGYTISFHLIHVISEKYGTQILPRLLFLKPGSAFPSSLRSLLGVSPARFRTFLINSLSKQCAKCVKSDRSAPGRI